MTFLKILVFELLANLASGQGITYTGPECHGRCGSRGGKCSFCGTDGYCCRRGYSDCSSTLASYNPNSYHGCLYMSLWGSWGSWTSCTKTCGPGTKRRTRSCRRGSKCSGSSSQTTSCNIKTCVYWSSWGSWGACSRTCNSGTQISTRTCPRDPDCSGSTRSKSQSCLVELCASWTTWGAWGDCNINCGPGKQTSLRSCSDSAQADRTGHKDCTGDASKLQDCSLKDCVTIECEKETMCVKFDKQHLSRNSVGDDYELNLDSCEASDTRKITTEDIEMCAELGIGKCGAEMEMNATHVNYKNNVLATKVLNPGVIRFENVAYNNYKLPYHCAYPLEYLVTPSADTDDDGVPDSNYGSFLPKISEVVTIVSVDMTKGGIKGDGKFPVAMMMYQTDEYKIVYDSPPTLNVDSRLYIQTHLLKGPDEATVQTKKCWMTSTKDIDDPLSYTIIDDYCPVADAVAKADVALLTNGVNFISRWEVDVFKFTGKDDIFVHCRVRLCFKSDDQVCNDFKCPENNRRKRRSEENDKSPTENEDDDIVVSVGPLSVDGTVLEIKINSKENSVSEMNAILIGILSAALILCTIILMIVCRRKFSSNDSKVDAVIEIQK